MAQFAPPPMGPRRAQSISDLIMHQGDIAARGAANSGAIWGGVARDLGQIAGGAIQQHQERKSQEQRSQGINAAIQGWDGKDLPGLYRGLAPFMDSQEAIKTVTAFGTLQNTMRELQEGRTPSIEDTKAQIQAIVALEDASPGYIEQNYAQIAPILGPGASAHFGWQPAEQWDESVTQSAKALSQSWAPKPGTRTVTTTNPDGSKVEKIVRDVPGQEFESAAPPPPSRESEWALVPGDPTQERNKFDGRVRPSGVQPKPADAPKAPDPVWGTASTDAERKRVGVTRTGLAKLSEWKTWAEDNPDLIGPIEGRKTLLQQKTGLGATVETGKKKAQMAILRNAVLNALSGAAVNPQEFERLREQVPEIQDSEEDFYGKIEALDEYFREVLQDYRASPRAGTLEIDPSRGTSVDISSWNLPGVTVVRRLP